MSKDKERKPDPQDWAPRPERVPDGSNPRDGASEPDEEYTSQDRNNTNPEKGR